MRVYLAELCEPGTQVAATAGAIYTSPAGTESVFNRITLYNTNTTTETVIFHIVPSGGSAVDANIIHKEVVPAGKSVPVYLPEGVVMQPSDALYASTDTASKVNIFGGVSQLVQT